MMTLSEAIRIARRTMAEHGGIEHNGKTMQSLNPDNAEQNEIAEAYNVLAEFHPKARKVQA